MNSYLRVDEVVESISKTHSFNKEKLKFLNTSDVYAGKIVNINELPVTELKGQAKKTIKQHDILFSEIRPKNRRFAYVDLEDTEDFVVSTKLMVLRRFNPDVDNKYLYYFLTNDRMLSALQDRAENRICSFPQITFDLLSDYKIRVPKLSEQRNIAAVLSALDARIDCNNRINVELEAMAKTLYDYWFVQFDFPDANGKPYKSSGGKMVYNPALKREIPEGWHDAVVADILDKTPSSTKILNKEILDTGVIPVIDQSQSYICGFTDEKSSLIVPKQPHVVFGDHTRVVKLVNFSYARGADGTQILVSKDMRMPGYLLHQVVSDIDLSSYGYARHYKFLKESKIILPNQTNAQKYQAVVTPWLEKTRESIFENLELARLRDWLLPLLMNGQVTVA